MPIKEAATTRTLCGTLGTHGRPAACAILRTQEGAVDEEWRKIGQKDIPLE